MLGRFGILLGLWGALLIAPPAFAHEDHAKPCEAKLLNEDTQVQLLTRLENLEQNLKEIFRTYQQLPYPFIDEFQLAKKIAILVDGFKYQLDEALRTWDPSSTQSSLQIEKIVNVLEYKIARLSDENRLWQDRFFVSQKTDLAEVRGDRLMVLPNRIYDVQTDRGESVRVRFSRSVVEDFLWLTSNADDASAADKALGAIARGFQPPGNRSAAGICVYRSAIAGETVYGLKFNGKGKIGAHRVYGLMKDGVIGFVTHESDSGHDARYLNRVMDRAIKAHQAQKW